MDGSIDQFATFLQIYCKKTSWKPFGVTVHSIHITNEMVIFIHTEGSTYGYNLWRLIFDSKIGLGKALGVQARIAELYMAGADLDTILKDILNATAHLLDV